MKKRGFTMIELVFVIVIIGILAGVSLPRFNRSSLREAAEQISSHIRYTQHLALQDDKFDTADANWFKKRWSITFNNTNISECSIGKSWKYSVFSDTAGGSSGNLNSGTEVAGDPQKLGHYLSAGWSGMTSGDCKKVNKNLNIEKVYKVRKVKFDGSCSGSQTISFDEIGRPMRAVSTTSGGASRAYDRLLYEDCKITLENGLGGSVTIQVAAQTGHVSIL